MKKKFKSKLILMFAALASLLLLGGCKVGESLEEVRDNRDLVSQVTYYSNGGIFDGDPDRKEMYYTSGSEVFNVGVTGTLNGTATLKRANHDFGGWYYAEMNGEEPVFEDADKKYPKISDKKVEFPLTIGENEHLFLVAKWLPHVKVQVKIAFFTEQNVAAPTLTMTAAGTTYANGDDLSPFTYNDGYVQRPGSGDYYAPLTPSTVQDFTFVDYYFDAACEQPLISAWPIVKAEEQTTDAVIYAKYIPGEWNIVREASDVYTNSTKGMLSEGGAGKRYWVANDITADVKIAPLATFDWEIWGNGFTISGLKITERNVDGDVSVFGQIKSTAVIKDLTLDNMNIRYAIKQGADINVFFSFTSMEEGANISQVKLRGEIHCTKTDGFAPTPRLYGVKGSYTSDTEYANGTNGQEFIVEKTNN